MNVLTTMWIVIAISFGILEGVTVSLVSIWFCLGAAFSAAISVFTDSIGIQILVFSVVSVVSFISARPVVKMLHKVDYTPTNFERVIGEKGKVVEKIDPAENKGQIKVNGQIWSAKSDEEIEVGEIVEVEAVEGVKLLVKGGK